MRNKEIFNSALSQEREEREGKGREIIIETENSKREWLLQEDKTNGYFRQKELYSQDPNKVYNFLRGTVNSYILLKGKCWEQEDPAEIGQPIITSEIIK